MFGKRARTILIDVVKGAFLYFFTLSVAAFMGILLVYGVALIQQEIPISPEVEEKIQRTYNRIREKLEWER